MSNDTTTKENIIAPAIGRGLSAIAHRRTSSPAAKAVVTTTIASDEPLIAATTCARSCACAM